MNRNTALARIHATTKQLGMDRETYEAWLTQRVGATSCKGLTNAQLGLVLDDLTRLLGGTPKAALKGRPHNYASENAPNEFTKIDALLFASGKSWGYALGIAKKMYGVQSLAWCKPEQLRGVITALVKANERRDRGAK